MLLITMICSLSGCRGVNLFLLMDLRYERRLSFLHSAAMPSYIFLRIVACFSPSLLNCLLVLFRSQGFVTTGCPLSINPRWFETAKDTSGPPENSLISRLPREVYA